MENQRHPFPQAKVARVPCGSARSGRRRFAEKSSSPAAPVFSRKTLHSRDTHLLMPVEWNPPVPAIKNWKNGTNESQRS